MEKVIFKNQVIEVRFSGLGAKNIEVFATATSPFDGQFTTMQAGWISTTWYLHCQSKKVPDYIFEAAAREYHEHVFIIAAAILTHLKNIKTKQVDFQKNDVVDRIEFEGVLEPKYGICDVVRHKYKSMGENLEAIKYEREQTSFVKFPTQNLPGKIKVSR